MNNYEIIIQKIQSFIRKYYLNELIRGSIFFVTLGLLYFLGTLLIEYFLWLKPFYRTGLFWFFIIVESLLLYRFIFLPIFRLIGLKKTLTLSQASDLIGKHFPEVDDKLINMLQLHNASDQTELVVASIDLKAASIKPFVFTHAVDFTLNTKYLKFLALPISFFLLIYVSGYQNVIKDSYTRLTHPKDFYTPPAPFSLRILNDSLAVIKGDNFVLDLLVKGDMLPEEVVLSTESESFFLQRSSPNHFTTTFSNVRKNINFKLSANKVETDFFLLQVIAPPQITALEMRLQYPKYTQRTSETIINTGNATIPEGTSITWSISTQDTNAVLWTSSLDSISFDKNAKNKFVLSKTISNDMDYKVSTANKLLSNYENLSFKLHVINDLAPKIDVLHTVDSTLTFTAQFLGSISDDYGFHKLQVVYYSEKMPDSIFTKELSCSKSTVSDFQFIFPGDLNIQDSQRYALYFQVFDNDYLHGFKSVKSDVFYFYHKSPLEEEQAVLESQFNQIQDLKKSKEKQIQNTKALEQLDNQLKNATQLDFSKQQELSNILKRQEQYNEMMEKQSDKLKENLNQQPESQNEMLNEMKKNLQERMEEFKQTEQEKQLLKELQDLAEKLNKEDLLDKLQKMSIQNKQKEKSLEQLLELTKRFYVEQKMQQISDKLEKLANDQDKLQKSDANTKDKQDVLNKSFEDLQKEIEQLSKENEKLKEPMSLDAQKPEQESVKNDMQDASDSLENSKQSDAEKSQQKASKMLKQMAAKMKMDMASMAGDMIEEDIATLRRIIKNLLIFSFKQENLMDALNSESQSEVMLSQKLKDQNTLKTYFQHIDDSLYTLSLRQAKLGKPINEYLTNAHYYLTQSITSMEENQIARSRTNQQFVMTAANDLAVLLSNLLDNMKSSMSMGGSGEGKSGQSFSLPDIIQKQGELKKQAEGNSPGQGKPSDGKETNEGEKGTKVEETGQTQGAGKNQDNKEDKEASDRQTFEIYKQQALLREALENQLENVIGTADKEALKSVLRQMELLENMLLEKGITNQVLERMNRMEHDLLKLKNATYTKEKEQQRISKTNIKYFNQVDPALLEKFKNARSRQEILNTQPIPFQSPINLLINQYFNQNVTTP